MIPGGTPAAAHLHVCRTVCRRAERRTIAVEDANPEAVRYLNRLSDLLFILSRAANEAGEAPSPCGSRARTAPAARPQPAGPGAPGRERALGGAQRRDGQRHPQRGDEEAAEHVARHVPREASRATLAAST